MAEVRQCTVLGECREELLRTQFAGPLIHLRDGLVHQVDTVVHRKTIKLNLMLRSSEVQNYSERPQHDVVLMCFDFHRPEILFMDDDMFKAMKYTAVGDAPFLLVGVETGLNLENALPANDRQAHIEAYRKRARYMGAEGCTTVSVTSPDELAALFQQAATAALYGKTFGVDSAQQGGKENRGLASRLPSWMRGASKQQANRVSFPDAPVAPVALSVSDVPNMPDAPRSYKRPLDARQNSISDNVPVVPCKNAAENNFAPKLAEGAFVESNALSKVTARTSERELVLRRQQSAMAEEHQEELATLKLEQQKEQKKWDERHLAELLRERRQHDKSKNSELNAQSSKAKEILTLQTSKMETAHAAELEKQKLHLMGTQSAELEKQKVKYTGILTDVKMKYTGIMTDVLAKHKKELMEQKEQNRENFLVSLNDEELERTEQRCRDERTRRRRMSMEARFAQREAELEAKASRNLATAVAAREEELRAAATEERSCPICFENTRDHVFQCGHSACGTCATQLTQCHMCRVPIVSRIRHF